MSSINQPRMKTFKNLNDLSAKQYHFVKIGTTDEHVVVAGANEKTIGILMNAPVANEPAEVAIFGGGGLIKLTETLSALALLTPTSTGGGEQVDAADEWCGAQILEGGASGDVVECIVLANFASKSDA
jgi:hypothetical protein